VTGQETQSSALPEPPYSPYASSATNGIYNLLFCDNRAAYAPKPGERAAPWQASIFSEPADAAALEALAADASQDGRVRLVAYGRLRELGSPVQSRVLLGVVVEVGFADGLDVLAAFSEGGVRYLNKSGKVVVFEGIDSLRPLVRNLFEVSGSVVERIGPWDGPRRPPPGAGMVRLTFLVSDGLYFGEGPIDVMQREPMAGPVIGRAGELLQAVVAMASNGNA
jgi:hypothetical protein